MINSGGKSCGLGLKSLNLKGVQILDEIVSLTRMEKFVPIMPGTPDGTSIELWEPIDSDMTNW